MDYAYYGSTLSLYKRLKKGIISENGLGVISIDILRALEYIH